MPSSGYSAPLSAMPSIPAITASFLMGVGEVSSKLGMPPSLDRLKALAKKEFSHEKRILLEEVIRDQYHGLSISPETERNISRLAKKGTFTVCTGHQCCLLTGPLYVPGKIMNTIRLAAELTSKGVDSVPLFWMHTEDHDIAEVDHVFIHGKKITWAHNGTGAAGQLLLNGIDDFLEQVVRDIGGDTQALLDMLRHHYKPGNTVAQATRSFLNELFGRFGLLILDPADQRLKSTFAESMIREVDQRVVKASLDQTNKTIESFGFQPAVNPREINLFYLSPGKRERIVQSGEKYKAGEKEWTTETLRAEIVSAAHLFSPNVALRAVYQQTILPNIAYVGGPGEIAYWLQFGDMLRAFDVSSPVLIPRNNFFLVNEKQRAKLMECGIAPVDMLKPLDDLIKSSLILPDLRKYSDAISELVRQLADEAAAIDPTLKASALGAGAGMEKSLDQVRQKMIRALKQKEEVKIQRLKSLKESLFPNGLPMERQENFLLWFSSLGPAFFDTLMREFEPIPEHCLFIETP